MLPYWKIHTTPASFTPHHTSLQKKDGKAFTSSNRFTCPAQADPFKELLQTMSERPQDYISTRGRTTTNAVEGLHGLALMYRDKRTDLGAAHYVCKTNMCICHKVLKYTLWNSAIT